MCDASFSESFYDGEKISVVKHEYFEIDFINCIIYYIDKITDLYKYLNIIKRNHLLKNLDCKVDLNSIEIMTLKTLL